MGAQKLLLPFGATTVVGHIVAQLLASAVDEVCVVVGHDAGRMERELAASPVAVVANPEYDSGMLSSVRCGLRALPERCQAVLVALGDQPSLSSGLVDDMVRAFAATDRGILVPSFGNRRGHPILFSLRYRAEVLTHYDGVGLRGLLQAHPDDILELPVSTSAVLADMDFPEDYQRELMRAQKPAS